MQNQTVTDLLGRTEDMMRHLITLSGGQAALAALEHLDCGGKRIRARLSIYAATALDLQDKTAVALAAACELIHNASLVHDDIQDQSEIRRGTRSLWAHHGVDIAICAGDLLISAAYAAIAEANAQSAGPLIGQAHKRISQVISGQCKDLTADVPARIDLDSYKYIATLKSAPLLALPMELPLIEAGYADSCIDVDKASSAFARAYQMADDIEDVTNDVRQGRPNIVCVLGGQSETAPQVAQARAMAAKHYDVSAKIADKLPRNSGALLAKYARMGALKLTPLGAVA